MAFVPAICSKCGANISVNNTEDAGICQYCGTAFVTQKVINNYIQYNQNISNNYNQTNNINIYNNAYSINSVLDLAQNYVDTMDVNNALKYCDQALSMDSKSSRAWYIKMQAEKIRVQKTELSVTNAKSIDAIKAAGNNAIRYSSNSITMKKDVYKFLLKTGAFFFELLKLKINALESLSEIMLLNISTHNVLTLSMINEVSDNEIKKDINLQNNMIECINNYVDFRNTYYDHLQANGLQPDKEAVTTMESEYDSLVEKLPEDRQDEIKEWTIEFDDSIISRIINKIGVFWLLFGPILIIIAIFIFILYKKMIG